MKIALITGITGQDGSYMAELLLSKGYRVIGLIRSALSFEHPIIKSLQGRVELDILNAFDHNSIFNIVSKYRPNEIYNFAAYSSGSDMYANPLLLTDLNGLFVVRILESIRLIDPNIRFCQASSREIFGEPSESPQSELTLKNPRSPYGAAKLYADNMINIYRRHHDIFACSAILFNHESPRRRINFVTRKITNQAAKIKFGIASKLTLGNLDAIRDWGYAGDYVEAMWIMLQKKQPEDYVLATGEQHSVRDFCEIAFNTLSLDYKKYVQEERSLFRDKEKTPLIGNAMKAHAELEWLPKIKFTDLVKMMVDADIKETKRLIKE
jgi:GDPmannose 4,6-dehydratase